MVTIKCAAKTAWFTVLMSEIEHQLTSFEAAQSPAGEARRFIIATWQDMISHN